jgi:Na+-driven multidrug efflux pump
VLGAGFALIAPYLSSDLAPLAKNLFNILLFAAGVGLSSVTLILDQALIGLLRGQAQLWRNTIFAAVKAGALLLVLVFPAWDRGLMIYATWGLGNLISVLYLFVWRLSWAGSDGNIHRLRPQWGLLRDLRGPALRHHALNMSLQVPGFTLPILVTVVLSARSTASFYTAFMITSFLFTMPYALTTVLYAVGAADPSLLAEKIRFTLGLSLLVGTAGAVCLLAGAYPIMYSFGESYAAQATGSLRVLTLAIFPIILKVHFVAVSQIHGRMLDAARIMAVGGVIELSLATLGAHMGGQTGLCLGWVIAICFEGLAAAPLVYHTATSGGVLREVEQPG